MEPNEIRILARMIVNELDKNNSADLANKFEKGKIIVMPGDPTTKEHEIPIEKFMHKIVMLRDNLRVLEQQINSNYELSVGEKLKFQGYITKCYGTMTSFNFLFKYEEDKFSSK